MSQPLWVALYETWQEYGGPEEGGWWYGAGEPLWEYSDLFRSFFNRAKARDYKNYLIGHFKADSGPSVGVGGCGDDEGLLRGERCGRTKIAVMITRGKPEGFPKRSPRWE